jgi:membrane-anchored protein YejM (alkaline phosphatase superfamily)
MAIRSGTFFGIIAVLFFFFILTYSDSITTKERLSNKINELECEKQQYKQELYKSSVFRDSLYRVIDSLSNSKKVILRSLKLIPVYVPGKFDTLKNEQLHNLMIKEYIKHK